LLFDAKVTFAGNHKINMGTIKEYHFKVPAPNASNPKKHLIFNFTVNCWHCWHLIFQRFLGIWERAKK